MEKFNKITAVAAPMPIINIDTDMIIPKQFLKTVKRTGLGANLFDEMRFNLDGSEVADFVLNREPYRNSGIIVAGENFGCGSSREHAPWSLVDFGISCVIAPSFADIFYNNCFKNGILPIKLEQEKVDELMQVAGSDNPEITVDLESQTIIAANKKYEFELDPFRKKCLLEGLDDIGLTLAKVTGIDSFEEKNKQDMPWLYGV